MAWTVTAERLISYGRLMGDIAEVYVFHGVKMVTLGAMPSIL